MVSGSNPPPPDPPSGSIAQAIVQWLTGISTWSRAGIAIVLGLTALLGYLIFTYPQSAYDLVVVVLQERHGARPRVLTLTPYRSDVRHELDRLLRAMGDTMLGAMVWRIEFADNSMTLVEYVVKDEYRATLHDLEKRWLYPVTVFRDRPKINDIIARLYIGEFVCTTPENTWDEVLQRLPIAEICLSGIPPEGIGLAGLLAGGWTSTISADDRSRVEMAFRSTARALVQ